MKLMRVSIRPPRVLASANNQCQLGGVLLSSPTFRTHSAFQAVRCSSEFIVLVGYEAGLCGSVCTPLVKTLSALTVSMLVTGSVFDSLLHTLTSDAN